MKSDAERRNYEERVLPCGEEPKDENAGNKHGGQWWISGKTESQHQIDNLGQRATGSTDTTHVGSLGLEARKAKPSENSRPWNG